MSFKRNFILISIFALLSISTICALKLYEKIKPSTEKMDLYNYYKMGSTSTDTAALIIQDEIASENVIIDNNVMYLEKGILYDYISTCFYWNSDTNQLIVTTPNEYITVDYQSLDYFSNSEKQSMDSIIMKQVDGKTYVSIPFVEMFANIEYAFYDNPNRLVLKCKWGEEFTMATVSSSSELRYDASAQTDILSTPKAGAKLIILEESCGSDKDYTKVATEDGLIGYIKSNALNASYTEILTNNYEGYNYQLDRLDYVSMGWYNVAGKSGNSYVSDFIKGRTGMNVISPTWFAVSDTEGGIRSFASEDFVTTCHNAGLEVWPTVNDFDYEKVSLLEVIKDNNKRKILIDNLVNETVKFKCNGINVDFEHITEESSPYYIQFLREITVACHQKDLILSVDSYVPVSYRAQYKLDEQAEFVDYVVIMAYDEYGEGSPKAGPTSSIKWVKTAVDKTLTQVPKHKIVIGIPFFMRYWKLNSSGVVSTSAMSMSDGIATLKNAGVVAGWDESTGQYFAEYSSGGYTHKIWLESASSVKSKLEYIMSKDVAGAAYWRLGYEDVDEVWEVISQFLK